MLGPDLDPAKGAHYKVAAAIGAGLILGVIVALLGVYFLTHEKPLARSARVPRSDSVQPMRPALHHPVTRMPGPAAKSRSSLSVALPHPPVSLETRHTSPPVTANRNLPDQVGWQIQVFSWTPQRINRYVVINMHLYRTGSHLPGGARLLAIQSDGLLVKYHGRRYFVPRP